MKPILLALALALATPPAGAQIYKWVDEKGRVQYGEKPPTGAKSAPLRSTEPSGAAPRPAEDFAGKDQEFRRRQIERRDAEEKQAQEAQATRARCEYARNQLASSEQASVIYRMERGEKVYLNSDQHRAELERVRALVTRYCR